MTVQELMKPRYKVIADYPESIFTIGDVLTEKDVYGDSKLGIEVYKITRWELLQQRGHLPDRGFIPQVISLHKGILPATKEEYDAYRTNVERSVATEAKSENK